MADKLTPKQRKFIACYSGNGVEAAKAAGYKGNDKTLSVVASENLAKPYIAAEIKKREDKEVNRLVMNRLDRQIFWSEIIKTEDMDISARLRASELLGKSEADFTERVVNVDGNLADRLARARARASKKGSE